MGFHEELLQSFQNFKNVFIDDINSSVSDLESGAASLSTENSAQTSQITSLSVSTSEIASELASMSTSQSLVDSTQNSQLTSLSVSASELASAASSMSAIQSTHTSEINSLSIASSELGSQYTMIASEVATKQDALTPGTNISIIGNVISANVQNPIDDSTISTEKTWSSKRLNRDIGNVFESASLLGDTLGLDDENLIPFPYLDNRTGASGLTITVDSTYHTITIDGTTQSSGSYSLTQHGQTGHTITLTKQQLTEKLYKFGCSSDTILTDVLQYKVTIHGQSKDKTWSTTCNYSHTPQEFASWIETEFPTDTSLDVDIDLYWDSSLIVFDNLQVNPIFSLISIDVEATSNLADLTDTNITSPTDKQILMYDNTSGKWINDDASSDGHIIKDGSGSTLTQRPTMQFNVPFTSVDDSTNLKTDIGLQKLTSGEMDDIVTPLPSRQVHVSSLSDLGDVNTSTPTNGQVLTFNSSTNKWENKDNSGGGTDYSSDITSLSTENSTQTSEITSLSQSISNLESLVSSTSSSQSETDSTQTASINSLASYVSSMSDYGSEIGSLASVNSTQTSELTLLSQSMSEIASTASSLTTVNSTQNSQLSSLSAQNSTQSSELASLSTAASELASETTVLSSEVATKQDALTAGTNISISNNVISASSSGSSISLNNTNVNVAMTLSGDVLTITTSPIS